MNSPNDIQGGDRFQALKTKKWQTGNEKIKRICVNKHETILNTLINEYDYSLHIAAEKVSN